jgi:hypothetical protein
MPRGRSLPRRPPIDRVSLDGEREPFTRGREVPR